MSVSDKKTTKKTTNATQNRSCFKVAGISCSIFVIIFLILLYLLYSMLNKNPSFSNIGKCMTNLGELSGAIDRYVQKKGVYPKELDMLYPNFLEDKTVLRCPADETKSDKSNYEYTIPSDKASDDTPVVICKKHKIMEAEMWLYLLKNGMIQQYSVIRGPNAEEKLVPGIQIDPKSLQK